MKENQTIVLTKDGQEETFILARPTLKVLSKIDTELAKAGIKLSAAQDRPFTMWLIILWCRLRPNYPELKMDDLGDMVESKSQMKEIIELATNTLTELVEKQELDL